MHTIDIHTHILPKNIPDWAKKFGYGEFIRLEHHKPCCARMMKGEKFFREIEENCWAPETRVDECKRHGVHRQVLSTVPVMFSYWTKPQDGLSISEFLNDDIANTVKKFPESFFGLGTVPMQDVRLAIKELERCKKIGLDGVQIGTNINQKNLGDSEFLEFFLACRDLNMAVFVHPWEMMGEEYIQKYWLPWLVGMPAETSRAICSLIFSGTLEKAKGLKIAFAHGGGSFPGTFARIKHGFDCRPDLVACDNTIDPSTYIHQIYFDSLVHDQASLDFLLRFAGAERIALGSDYPFPLGENIPGKLIKESQLTDYQKERLLSGTALEWLSKK